MIRHLLLLAAILCTAAEPAAGPAVPAAPTAATPRVAYVPIDGVIDEHRSRQFERTLDLALAGKPQFVVVHLTTDGGMLHSAMEMLRKALKVDAQQTKLVAFIDNRAYSAGALIGYGCDRIYMTSDAYIGDIGVITIGSDGKIEYLPEKIESPVRALLRQAAQHNGWDEAKLQKMTARNQDLLRFTLAGGKTAFVIEDDLPKFLADHQGMRKEDGVLILGKDRLLTYTAKEAVTEGMATGLAKDLADVYRQLGADPAQVQKFEPTGNERIAERLGGWAPILAALAVLFLILEFKMGGNGLFLVLAGITGALFLFCQFYLDLAGAPELILIIVGIAAIAAEVFLLPTGGLLALGGAVALVVGLVLAFMPDSIQFQPGTEGWDSALGLALKSSLLALLVFTAGVVIGIAALPRSRAGKALASQAAIDGTSAGEVEAVAATLVGRRGTARTMLRPSGFVLIDGKDLAASVANGTMVEPGGAVEVIEARFGELVVRPVAPAEGGVA